MYCTGQKGKDKLFNFRPVFFTAVSICVGIVFCFLHIFYGVSLWWLLLLVGLGIPFIFCSKKKLLKTAIAVAVLILAFFVGFTCFGAQVRAYTNAAEYVGEYTVRGTVEEKVVGKSYGYVVLSDISVEGKEEKFKLTAYLPRAFCDEVELFDEILLTGEITTSSTNAAADNFSAYAIRDGLKYQMKSVDSCVVVGHKFDLFGVIRVRMQKALYRGMDDEPASVVLAVLTGNTQGIEDGLLSNIRYGGIAHIFAVSGLHVGALFAFCMLLVTKTKLKKLPKIFRFLLVTIMLIFYGGVCGFSASVLRAIVLCLVGYAAKLIGVAIDKFETLGLAAIFVLLISPVELFCAGFQLSFLACLGIFLWGRPIEKWGYRVCDKIQNFVIERRKKSKNTPLIPENEEEKPGITFWGKVRQIAVSFIAVSLAAQIGTAPVLLQSFGYLSGWSLLLNFFFVPFISLVFSVLLLLVTVACVLPLSISHIILYLPNLVWSVVLLLFEGFDFSSFAIKDVTLNAGAFICYFGTLSFFTDKWNLALRQKRWFALIGAIGFFATVIVGNIIP